MATPLQKEWANNWGGASIKAPPSLSTPPSLETLDQQTWAAAELIIGALSEMKNSLIRNRYEPRYAQAVVTILRYFNITTAERLWKLVKFLDHYGYAKIFYNLALHGNSDEFRTYLLTHGFTDLELFQLYEESIWDTPEFYAGLLEGLAATIGHAVRDISGFVVAYYKFMGWDILNTTGIPIVKIIKLLQEPSEKSAIPESSDPSEPSLFEQVKMAWHTWNEELFEAGMRHDYRKYGYLWGRMIGEVWMILDGVTALAKVVGLTLKTLKFSILFLKNARFMARAEEALARLIDALLEVEKDIPEVGITAAGRAFQASPEAIGRWRSGAFAAFNNDRLLGIRTDIYSSTGNVGERSMASRKRTSVVLLHSTAAETKVIARCPPLNTKEGQELIKQWLEQVSDIARGKPLSAEDLAHLKIIEKEVQAFTNYWRNELIKALEHQNSIPEIKEAIRRHQFGTLFHEHVKTIVSRLEAKLPGFKIMSETTLIDVAREMSIEPVLLKRAKMTIFDFLKPRKDLWLLLGAKNEKELLKVIKKLGYDPHTSLIGNMRCDVVFYDWFYGKIFSYDFTSGLGRVKFIKIFETSDFTELPKLLARHLRHSQREYVVRQAVMSFIFEGRSTVAREVLYQHMPSELVKLVEKL